MPNQIVNFRYSPEKRFRTLAFSYHPSETSESSFLKKLDQILQRDFSSVLIVFVLYDQDIQAIESMFGQLGMRNVGVSISRCTLPGGREYRLSDTNEQLAAKLIDEARVINAAKNQLPAVTTELRAYRGVILCPTGYKNFHIEPDGNVYTCMSALDRSKIFGQWALPHYQPIGNITDPKFTYLENPFFAGKVFVAQTATTRFFRVLGSSSAKFLYLCRNSAEEMMCLLFF
jgi:hypothetical protein